MTGKTVKLDTDTIAKLDKVGKRLCEEMGIKNPSYTQIIEYILKQLDGKKKIN